MTLEQHGNGGGGPLLQACDGLTKMRRACASRYAVLNSGSFMPAQESFGKLNADRAFAQLRPHCVGSASRQWPLPCFRVNFGTLRFHAPSPAFISVRNHSDLPISGRF